ncbi:winged helix-turn-helix transcriptional regulator [Candidatus Woesearchaeota archaeon]|nr:winged helix-turn-helix transcriptional regulator [Candidatus Woesearchaeota archaeon]
MEHTLETYDLFFGSLANPNRVQILNILRDGPKNVTQICQVTGFEQTMVSHNLKRLERCGMVFVEPNGKQRIYSLNHETIKPLMEMIDKHMSQYCVHVLGACHHEK